MLTEGASIRMMADGVAGEADPRVPAMDGDVPLLAVVVATILLCFLGGEGEGALL